MKYVEVNLPVGQLVAMVDDEDFEKVSRHSWNADKNHYAISGVTLGGRPPKGRGFSFRMHRLVLGLCDPVTGWFDATRQVHHIDNDPLNNQKSNLKIASPSENARSKVRKPEGSTSQYRGVNWDSKQKKWRAHINIGAFDTELEAAKAWNRVAEFCWGDLGQLNKLGGG